MSEKETWSYHNTGSGFALCIQHGSVEIETRMMPSNGGIFYQGRAVHKNKHGGITKITPWETTGVLR